jgi:hypothetical protein
LEGGWPSANWLVCGRLGAVPTLTSGSGLLAHGIHLDPNRLLAPNGLGVAPLARHLLDVRDLQLFVADHLTGQLFERQAATLDHGEQPAVQLDALVFPQP